MEKEITLETAFASLEETIQKMEDPKITLDESLKLYQEGVKLLQFCNETIDRVEKQMIVLQTEETSDEI